jgi:hypothetical protein
MKRVLPAIALLILIGLLLGWWFLPENVLKRRVGSLFDTASVPITMSELARSSRGPNVAEYLSMSVDIAAPENFDDRMGAHYNRDDAAAFYSATARYCRQISFLEPEFTQVRIDGESAKVALDIDTIVELPDRRPVDGILKIEMSWEKVENRWLLSKVAWEEQPR